MHNRCTSLAAGIKRQRTLRIYKPLECQSVLVINRLNVRVDPNDERELLKDRKTPCQSNLSTRHPAIGGFHCNEVFFKKRKGGGEVGRLESPQGEWLNLFTL